VNEEEERLIHDKELEDHLEHGTPLPPYWTLAPLWCCRQTPKLCGTPQAYEYPQGNLFNDYPPDYDTTPYEYVADPYPAKTFTKTNKLRSDK